MASMYATKAEVQQELSSVCARVGIAVEATDSALLYTTATDPRTALKELRSALDATIFRVRTTSIGAEESWITVLDAIDRPMTIKIRRQLA
ncbi:hypothetical protein ACFYTQ_26485 [Nocardia sp. NPDC004068]|uniref:hypothetical protein n=1 Tax=Nocardia sp. NPDC004068 TaxID=3364303 RepID=UPI0036B4D0BD